MATNRLEKAKTKYNSNTMPKRNRLQLGLKTLLVAFTLVGIGVVVVQWLQTDTIIYFEKSCTVRLPNGRRVTTNRWFNRDDIPEWVFFCTDVENEYFLCDNSDTTKVAVLQYNGEEYPAVVVAYRIEGPNYRGEYWIRSGKRLEPSTN